MQHPTKATFAHVATDILATIKEGIADGTYDLDSLGWDEIAECATEFGGEMIEIDDEEDTDTPPYIAYFNALFEGAQAATDENATDWRLAFDAAKFVDVAWSSWCAAMGQAR
jgi:hypothetical protein